MPLIDARDSVLIVIDTQPGFYAEREDVDRGAFDGFVARVAWVTALAAALDVPIVETVERPERNGDTAPAVKDAVPAGSPRFTNPTFGVADNDDIRAWLTAQRRRTAVLAGMETDVCVAHSSIGLCDLGFRVAVVADATYSPARGHDHGLERLRGTGAELLSAKGLFYEWLPSLEHVRRFKQAHPDLRRPPGFHL
jgi:nicotinamidase-related amidase